MNEAIAALKTDIIEAISILERVAQSIEVIQTEFATNPVDSGISADGLPQSGSLDHAAMAGNGSSDLHPRMDLMREWKERAADYHQVTVV